MRTNERNADTRFSFTASFIVGATMMARRAADIEAIPPADIGEHDRLEHRAYVVASIMQAAGAIESEIAEVAMHGPGHHLGSNGVDANARDLLQPRADEIDRKRPAVKRYAFVLQVLGKPSLDCEGPTWKGAALLMRLRNEIVHYKSRWGDEMTGEDLWKSLQALGHAKPPFRSDLENFFPHRCLSAPCAAWAAKTSGEFIDAFYDRLSIASPLEGHRERLQV